MGGIDRTITKKKWFSLAALVEAINGITHGISNARFEWGLVAFGTGIAAYFAWPTEPNLTVSITLFIIMLALSIGLRVRLHLSEFLMIAVFVIAGFSRGATHTKLAAAPILPEYRKSYQITGWVEKITRRSSLPQFYIRVQNIDGLSATQTPHRVRIRSKPHMVKPGDAISVKAVLNAPPGPVMSGGYDPARVAYFQQLGGYGFAVSVPEQIQLEGLDVSQRFQRKIVRMRYGLSRHIQARAPPATAGLQAALLTGDRSAIPPLQEQVLRDAGLAHLLAISGMHMGLLAGGAYFLASLLFSMIGPLARRYDMRKWAAVIGALFASAYLLMSGASVSTQRAYIMAMVVFAALIFDRRALSMRSVSLAAAITLMLHPESLMSAGFQMSFSATAALVAVYAYWSARRQFRVLKTPLGSLWTWFKGLSLTSFVAGAATAGFAALHFHRFAKYGLIANLAAMPVFTFVAMPAGFFAVLLMPFGLDIIPLKIMGLGLDFIIWVSEWVAGLTGAISHIKSANGTVMALFGMGFVWLCLGPKQVRIGGAAFMGISFFIWGGLTQADMRISQSARIAFWDPQAVNVLLVDRKRGDKFGRGRFMEAAGTADPDIRTFAETGVLCDMLACRLNIKGSIVSIVHEPEGVSGACQDSDLVILTLRRAGPRARRGCGAQLLDVDELEADGARTITITKAGIKIATANPERRKARPWGRR